MAAKPIVVIGAGFAGLSAALDLHRAGKRVLVLEAHLRVGGRVQTLREFGEGRIAEAGAEFIDPDHFRVKELANEFGLSLEIVPDSDQRFSWLALEGKIGATNDSMHWGVSVEEELTKIETALAEIGKGVHDPANPQEMEGADRLDQMTVESWLESLDVHPLARKTFTAHMQALFLVEPTGHSMLDLVRWEGMDGGEKVEGPTTHILGGNDQLAEAIASELPDVRLLSQVTAVQQKEDSVLIIYDVDGRPARVMAERVIMAVPINVMRSIHFEPPLSPAHQNAFQHLRLGPVTKVILEYERPFWNELGWSGDLLTDLPLNCIWPTTGGQVGSGGMLTVYTGGQPAVEFSSMRDKERVSAVLAHIESLFPGSSPLLLSSQTIAWLNESFIGGGYTFFPPGTVTKYYAAMRQPQGRIHFAGEHTAVYQGYMEGAVESGQRAASEVLDLDSQPAKRGRSQLTNKKSQPK